MALTVLVPHDGSSQSQDAFEYALETFPEERLVLFRAIDPFEVEPDRTDEFRPLSADWLDDRRERVSDAFDDAIAAADVGSTTVETDSSVGSPAQTILAYAEDTEVDQIVMGSRGRGRGGGADLPLGSTAEVVVRRAGVPVTVVR